MKAAFIGGEFHGTSREIPLTVDDIYYPKYGLTNFELIQTTLRVKTATEAYWAIPCYAIHSIHTIELSIYAHNLTMIADRADTMRRACDLYSMARILGVAVGLNRWLDAETETRLCYDADLQRSLFAARIQYDCKIAEIVGRRTNQRLIRRFPETFSDS